MYVNSVLLTRSTRESCFGSRMSLRTQCIYTKRLESVACSFSTHGLHRPVSLMLSRFLDGAFFHHGSQCSVTPLVNSDAAVKHRARVERVTLQGLLARRACMIHEVLK